ncbi:MULTISPECIES: ribosomal protein L7/L12 [Sporanaerobacter]|jgi:ribosomal protein L7/L12|uniref:Ribosomal protein L7/L12 C-terminal domain-containing protein n=1 Tax=Sporanaerobacter acetigenes DSM 13106 TaxID=1123281 RepID=A0A1M5YW83_9FIRM|nr:ribosomal protein L7/L12 [Sporanaerobacter acetigenes]SHI16124.1 Ribosomal protein L7/L12 C-terminal domain-containing protein [Sporanaerobacter acetigenes DSM 13106]
MENILYMGLIILFIILSSSINALESNQKRIESKLDRIMEHLGLPEPSREYISDELKSELSELVMENKKVEAIKRLREATGMGLKEAKDYVDSL